MDRRVLDHHAGSGEAEEGGELRHREPHRRTVVAVDRLRAARDHVGAGVKRDALPRDAGNAAALQQRGSLEDARRDAHDRRIDGDVLVRRDGVDPAYHPGVDPDAPGARPGEHARAGALRPRHVRHQRRLLGAARAAEVAETEVEAVPDVARCGRRGPAESPRPLRETGGVEARVVRTRGLGVDVRPHPVDERCHDLVRQAGQPLVVPPGLEQRVRRPEAERVVDDRRAADARTRVEREAAPREAETPEPLGHLVPVAGELGGLDSRTGFQHDDLHARLGEHRCHRRATGAGSDHDGVSRELHAARPTTRRVRGSREIPPARISTTPGWSLRRCHLVVDHGLELLEGLRADEKTPIDHERRRARDADRSALGLIGLHARLRLLVVEAVARTSPCRSRRPRTPTPCPSRWWG